MDQDVRLGFALNGLFYFFPHLPLQTGVVVVEVTVAVVAVVVVVVVAVIVLVVDDTVIVVVVLQLPHNAGQVCGKSKRSNFGLLQNETNPGFPQSSGSSTLLHTPLPDTLLPFETNITVAATIATAHDGRLPCTPILFYTHAPFLGLNERRGESASRKGKQGDHGGVYVNISSFRIIRSADGWGFVNSSF